MPSPTSINKRLRKRRPPPSTSFGGRKLIGTPGYQDVGFFPSDPKNFDFRYPGILPPEATYNGPPGFPVDVAPPPPPPPPPPYPGYLTPAERLRQARLEGDIRFGPAMSETRRQQAADQQRWQEFMTRLGGFSKAAAQLTGNAPGQISAAYGSAARDTAAFAKGFSDAMAGLQGQAAGDANAAIARAGGEPGQMINPTAAASNVLFGTGGYIPASTLEREGAAFSAQAAGVPKAILARGREDILGAGYRAMESAKEFDAKLRDYAKAKGLTVAQARAQLDRDQLGLRQYEDERKFRRQQYKDQKQAASADRALRALYQERDMLNRERATDISAATVQLSVAKNQQQADAAMAGITGFVYQDGKLVMGPDGQPMKTAKQRAYEADMANVDRRLDEQERHNRRTEGIQTTKTQTTAADKALAAANRRKTARAKAVANRNQDLAAARTTAAKLAKESYGAYVVNPRWKEGSLTQPKYLDSRGRPTSDVKKAARKQGYWPTFWGIWSEIDGDGLVRRYKLRGPQLREEVHRIMKRAGWVRVRRK